MSITKIIENSWDFGDDPSGQILSPYAGLSKHAGLHTTDPELDEFLTKLKPEKDVSYVLVNALGSGDYFGSNRNGDYFPETELIKSYKTFEGGHVFMHHVNKDPNKAVGTVPLAIFNPKMHRVELVLKLPHDKNSDFLDKIERGAPAAVSMGCKIWGDQCSLPSCGNIAKVKADYCEHIKEQLKKIDPQTHIEICMINLKPKFFDISQVNRPADRTAYALAKVANEGFLEYNSPIADLPISVALADELGYNSDSTIKSASVVTKKIADIDKDVPATEVMGTASLADIYNKFRKDVMPALRKSEPVFHKDVLHEMADAPSESLSTLAAHGVILKPKEYQRILLHHSHPNLADHLDKHNLDFTHVNPNRDNDSIKLDPAEVNQRLADAISKAIAQRSYMRGGLATRALGADVMKDFHSNHSINAEHLLCKDHSSHETEDIHDHVDADGLAALSDIGGSFVDYKSRARQLALAIARNVKEIYPDSKSIQIKIACLNPDDFTSRSRELTISPLGLTGVALGGSIYKLSEEMLDTIEFEFNKTASYDAVDRIIKQGYFEISSDIHPLIIDCAILKGFGI